MARPALESLRRAASRHRRSRVVPLQ